MVLHLHHWLLWWSRHLRISRNSLWDCGRERSSWVPLDLWQSAFGWKDVSSVGWCQRRHKVKFIFNKFLLFQRLAPPYFRSCFMWLMFKRISFLNSWLKLLKMYHNMVHSKCWHSTIYICVFWTYFFKVSKNDMYWWYLL